MPRAGLHCHALDASAAVAPPATRVAVCFFGLVRRIEHTLDGLERNLLGALRGDGSRGVDVFVHALLTHRVTSSNRFHAYAAESNVSLGEADFLALRPCRYAAEDQRVVDLDLQLHERAAATNAWRRANARRLGLKRYTESMLMNAYRAYYSLRQVGKLVRVHEASRRDRYTHVVAARPDCTIVSRFVWSDPPADTVVVPNFAHNSGVNDRFAFGTRAAMDVYMRRFDWLQSQYDRPHSPPEPWARGSSTIAPGVSKPYGWSGGRVGPGGWLGGRAAPVDALGNASETEALVCRYLIAARLRVGVTPICIVRVRATGVAVSEALNKTASPLGLPHKCTSRAPRHGEPPPLPLGLVSTSRDREWPCAAELRQTAADGVTTFRADAWIATSWKPSTTS